MGGRQRSGMDGTPALVTLALLATLQHAMAASYTVGDARGWSLNVDFKTWVSRYNFTVGDTLRFQYLPEQHNVLQVGETSYKFCNLIAPLKTLSSGADSVMLTQASTYYFICGVPGHCLLGMAVAIPVSETSSTPAPAVTPLPSPPKNAPSPAPAKAPPTASPSPSPMSSQAPSPAIPSPTPSEAVPSPAPSQETPSPSPSETTASPSPSPSEAIPPAAANPSSPPATSSQPQAPSSQTNSASVLQYGKMVLSSLIFSGFLLFLV